MSGRKCISSYIVLHTHRFEFSIVSVTHMLLYLSVRGLYTNISQQSGPIDNDDIIPHVFQMPQGSREEGHRCTYISRGPVGVHFGRVCLCRMLVRCLVAG